MRKEEAIHLIDVHKNALIDPVAMLHWTWLRVIIYHLSDGAWEQALTEAGEVLSQ